MDKEEDNEEDNSQCKDDEYCTEDHFIPVASKKFRRSKQYSGTTKMIQTKTRCQIKISSAFAISQLWSMLRIDLNISSLHVI